MATNEDIVAAAQQLYVSYYGRPADPAGLAFWIEEFTNSSNVDDALTAFGEGDEYLAWVEDNGLQDPVDLINALYNQMFNRDGDDEGVAFYVEQLTSGASSAASIALDIANGAQNDDATTLENKITVANVFTVDVEAEDAPYSEGDIPAAQALLADVDETEESVAAGIVAAGELVDDIVDAGTPTPGEDYVLTTATDVIESGESDDTYAAVASANPLAETFNVGDIIADDSDEDNDTLSIVATADLKAATVSDVENINVQLSVFAGADAVVDATNFSGSTITVWSDKLGFDGAAEVDAAGGNSVTAGAGVTALDVDGLLTGGVDTGAAATVTVSTLVSPIPDIALVGPTITVNGDVALSVDGAATNWVLNTTADASVTLADTSTAGHVAVTGDGDVTIIADLDGGIIDGALTTGTLSAFHSGGADAVVSLVDVDNIIFASPLSAGAVVVASGQTLTLLSDLSATADTFEPATATATVTDTLSITSLAGQSDIDVSGVASVTLTTVDLEGDGITYASIIGGTSLALVGAVDLDIESLAGVTVDITGISGDVTIGTLNAFGVPVTVNTATVLNAAGITGDVFNVTLNATPTIIGGNGTNTTFLADVDAVVTYTGGTGTDLILGAGLTIGTLAASTGDGSDIVVLNGITTGTVAFDGGAGLDVLMLLDATNVAGAAADTSLASISLFGVEVIAIAEATDLATSPGNSAVDALVATMAASQLDGMSYIVSLADAQGEALNTADITIATLTASAGAGVAGEGVDLGGLTVIGDVDFAITGADASGHTIVGSSSDDTIDAGTNGAVLASVLTGGGGSNTFVIPDLDSADATGAVITSITDYTSGTTALGGVGEDNDTIEVTTAVVAGAGTFIVTKADYVNAAPIFADASEGVTAELLGGIFTLVGLGDDVALADTLEEYITIAMDILAGTDQSVGFEFDGNTYLVSTSGGTAAVEDTSDVTAGTLEMAIELTGTTGMTLGAAVADDTIFIA